MIVGKEDWVGGRPADLFWFDFESKEETLFWSGGINANLIADSHLLYQSGTDNDPFMLQPFDVEKHVMLGSPVEVIPKINREYVRAFNSGDVLVAESVLCSEVSFQAFSEDGSSKFPEMVLPPGCFGGWSTSNDGSRVSINESPIPSESDLFVAELSTGSTRRLRTSTFDKDPIFSPEGDYLYLSTTHSGGDRNIYRRRADGLGEDELIINNGIVPAVSNDGVLMTYGRDVESEVELRIRNLQTNEDRMVDSSGVGFIPARFSPDSKFLVYRAAGGGQIKLMDIDSETKTITPLREFPQFSADSGSLYTLESGEVMSVSVSYANGAFQFGEKERLTQFEAGDWWDFRVASEGSLVVIRKESFHAGRDHTVIEWWQNFDTQLERISPTPDN